MDTINQLGQKIANFFKEETTLDLLSESKEEFTSVLNSDYLSALLPYRFYHPSHNIYENENSFGFILEIPPVLGMSSQAQEEISSFIREIGEEGASVQCLMWADPRIEPFIDQWSKPRNTRGGLFEKIASKKKKFLTDLSLNGDVQPRIFRFFFSYSVQKSKEGNQATIDKLVEKRTKAIASFSHFAIVHQPKPSDFLEMLSGLINIEPTTSIETRKKWNENAYLSDQICLPKGAITVNHDGLVFKAEEPLYFRSYEAIDFPDSWAMNMNQELLGDLFNPSYRFPSPFFIHYGIYFPNHEKTEDTFRAKAKILDHQFKFPSLVRMFPDMPRERAENDFVNKQLLEGELFIKTRLSIGLFADRIKFPRAESILMALYQKHGLKLKPNHFQHLHDFLFSLPMMWGENTAYMKDFKRRMLMRTTLTKETGNFIPLVGEWWGNAKHGIPLIGRRGQVATWDPFAGEGNLNAVVVGPSGSGKSVFMQEMITSELGQGGRVFILDLGRSFEKLCLLMGGQYLYFTQKSKLNLNPFNFVKSNGDIDAVNTALEIVSSIVATMAMPSEKIDRQRADLLSSIIKKTWQAKGEQSNIDDVIAQLEQSSFNSELMKGVTESLIEGLRKFGREGAYHNYFYGENLINFSSDLVVIETEELKNMPDLQVVILQIFALTVSNQIFMGDREKRCMICIDEAWDLLKSPQMEGFIESMARRLRKYNGSLIVGTQGLKDFERSHGARAALQNSNWLLMLGSDTDSINILKKDNLIPMDDHKEKMLNSLRKEDGKYSEVFIYHKGSGFFTLNQLRLDPFSAMLYSTKASDFLAIQELKNLGLKIEDAIEWMIIHKKEIKAAVDGGYRIKDVIEQLYRNPLIGGAHG